MDKLEAFEAIQKMRTNLIKYGRIVGIENPDRLNKKEIIALTARIFDELNEIDMAAGFQYHDSGVRCPEGIDKFHQEKLYMNFLDWYQVVTTPSGHIEEYVLQNYPKEKYPKIICVGDGENCHLGRKLAIHGYNAVSVDPEARKEFAGKSEKSGGKLHIVQGQFLKRSTDMIDWADLIVGSKVPQCAEELIGLSKPTVFNISNNAEIYKMRFKGTFIQSAKQLESEIGKCPGVSVKESEEYGVKNKIFVSEAKTRNFEMEIG